MIQQDRYTRVAVVLHWSIVVFIAANLLIGPVMEGLAAPLRAVVVRLHESFGATVFALTLLRILWRLTHKPPPYPGSYPVWEKRLANTVHGLLYFLMIAMPIAGWLIISADLRRPMILYGLITLPPFELVNQMPKGPAKEALHTEFDWAHLIGAWMLVSAMCLHIAGALKHQLIDGKRELQRMWFEKES